MAADERATERVAEARQARGGFVQRDEALEATVAGSTWRFRKASVLDSAIGAELASVPFQGIESILHVGTLSG